MTDSFEEKYAELLAQSYRLPHSDAKVSLVEEAVRLADLHQDKRKSFEARIRLVDAANHSGYPEKALVAFTWILAQHDRDEACRDTYTVLWYYKWILSWLHHFPQISSERIERSLDDMERRYLDYGYNLKPVHDMRMTWAQHRGDRDAATRHYELWRREQSDAGADCHACELNTWALYHVFMDEHEEALEVAKPLLAGRERCSSVPTVTYGHLFPSFFALGRLEEGARYHRLGYPKVKNLDHLKTAAAHLWFLVRTDNLTRATNVFQKHFGWALRTKDRKERFDYYRSALVLLARLVERSRKERKLRLPPEFELFRKDGTYVLAELEAWLEREATEIARAFDRRNGTSRFSDRLATVEAEAREVKRFAIRVRRKKTARG